MAQSLIERWKQRAAGAVALAVCTHFLEISASDAAWTYDAANDAMVAYVVFFAYPTETGFPALPDDETDGNGDFASGRLTLSR